MRFDQRLYSKSATAMRLGIDNKIPDKKILYNMCRVHKRIVEPCIEWFEKPVIINSGYRCPALNKAIKGSPTSQHMKGEAVDFEFLGLANKTLYNYIKNNMEFDQLILEFYDPKIGGNSGWVHCSITEGYNRREIFKIPKA